MTCQAKEKGLFTEALLTESMEETYASMEVPPTISTTTPIPWSISPRILLNISRPKSPNSRIQKRLPPSSRYYPRSRSAGPIPNPAATSLAPAAAEKIQMLQLEMKRYSATISGCSVGRSLASSAGQFLREAPAGDVIRAALDEEGPLLSIASEADRRDLDATCRKLRRFLHTRAATC